jgi:hypothetical protein
MYRSSGAATPPRRMPGTIRLAVALMLIIAVVLLAGVSPGFMAVDEMRAEMESAYSADETFTTDDANAKVRKSLIEGVVLTCLLSAVWIGMAVTYRSARHWARITGTVLFVLYTPLLALGLMVFTRDVAPGTLDVGQHMAIATPVVYVAMWVLALVIVILSWTPSANRHFRFRKAHPGPSTAVPPPPHPGR